MAANGVMGITDLRVIAFGNARENPDKTFTCQHGVPECKGNMVMACGIYVAKNLTAWWPYILCLERGSPVNDGAKCAASAKLDWNSINGCINDKNLSYEIMHGHAVETNALQPRKQYTPWVVLNDKPLFQDFNNMIQKICAAYTGTKPPGCTSFEATEEQLCLADA